MLAKIVVHKLRDHPGVPNILNIQCDHLSLTQSPNSTSNYWSPSQTSSVNHIQFPCQEKSCWGLRQQIVLTGDGPAPPEEVSSGWEATSAQKPRGSPWCSPGHAPRFRMRWCPTLRSVPHSESGYTNHAESTGKAEIMLKMVAIRTRSEITKVLAAVGWWPCWTCQCKTCWDTCVKHQRVKRQ